ncbi:MAG: hypothetical protein V4628_18385 [Pseudomonadota bacterium]
MTTPLEQSGGKCDGCNGNGLVTGTESDGSYQDHEFPFCKGTGTN